MELDWGHRHRVVNVPAPSVLWLADPPGPPHLEKPPLRAVLPRFMTIATEVSLDKKGRLVLGKITSAGIEARKLLEPKDGKKRSSYPPTCRASTIIKSVLSCKHEYKKPSLRPFVVEQRRKGRGERNPRIIEGVQMSFLYATAPDDQYPRVGKEFTGKLKMIPSFEFPEIILNSHDTKIDSGRLVLAADKTKKLLEHLILRVDVNDNLLYDLSFLLTLPSKNEYKEKAKGKAKVKAKGKVKGRELVQSHIYHGRWVWVTEQHMETAWRNVLVCQSADLMDARLAYWQWGDDPRRLEFIKTAIKGYPLVCGEYDIMEDYLGMRCMAPELHSYFHHPTKMSLEELLSAERLGWANLGGPTALAEEVSRQMGKVCGDPDDNHGYSGNNYGNLDDEIPKTNSWRFLWFFLDFYRLLRGRRADTPRPETPRAEKGKEVAAVTADSFPSFEAIDYIPGTNVPRLSAGFGSKEQVCWCQEACASGSTLGPDYGGTSSDDPKPAEVAVANQSKAVPSRAERVQKAITGKVVRFHSDPVTATSSMLSRTLTRASDRVVSSASRATGNLSLVKSN
ncbi:hypothetical protein ACMFMF_000435 [Clarireedia jacksonii]